jgi:hypothetical protein
MLIGTNSGIRNQTFYFCIIFGEGSNALLVPFFCIIFEKVFNANGYWYQIRANEINIK